MVTSKKVSSVCLSFFNILIVGAIGYLIKSLQMLHYPAEITNEDKESASFKMQIFPCMPAIITSTLISLLIFDAIGFLKSANAFYFIGYFFFTIIAFPLLIFKARF